MSNPKRSLEERIREMERKEHETLEKAKQLQAQRKQLKRYQEAEERKKRTHRLIQVGAAVESVLDSIIDEEDMPKLIDFLNRQEINGRFFTKAMAKKGDKVISDD